MKLVKKILNNKIALWIYLIVLALILILGFWLKPVQNIENALSHNQQTETYSSIKQIEKVHEVVLLNVGIQKIKPIENNTKLFGTKIVIPGSEKRAIIILNYTAKFGIKKGVNIESDREHNYKVNLPQYEVIGFELDKDKPYKLYDTSGGLLSASTQNVDTGEAAIKGLSNKEQQDYLKDYNELLNESAEKYYSTMIKSLDHEATVTVQSKK